jgi:hypothetical protein
MDRYDLALPSPAQVAPHDRLGGELPFFELQLFDDLLGARREITQFRSDHDFFRHARLRGACFPLADFLMTLATASKLPAAFTATHGGVFSKEIKGSRPVALATRLAEETKDHLLSLHAAIVNSREPAAIVVNPRRPSRPNLHLDRLNRVGIIRTSDEGTGCMEHACRSSKHSASHFLLARIDG